MKTLNILLSILIFIGGGGFILVFNWTYESKVADLKEKAKEAFLKALDKDLESKDLLDTRITRSFKVNAITTALPDSVFIQNESGEYWFRLDPVKNRMNITNDINLRALHTYAFSEFPIQPDSLNSIFGRELLNFDIFNKSALSVSVTNLIGNVKSQSTLQCNWCNQSNRVFTMYIGYICEIQVVGYIDYSIWYIMYPSLLLYILLYIAFVFGTYKITVAIEQKLKSMKKIEVIEVLSPPIIQVMNVVGATPVRSYILHEHIILYAEQLEIEVDGIRRRMRPQSCQLLELFLLEKENDYVLKDDYILKNLWPNGAGTIERMHKSVTRLRSFLHEIDDSIDIKRKCDTYQLLI